MKFAFTLLTLVLLVGTVFGQVSTGTLVGTVVDQNGGAVAGATVEVTDNATHKVRTVQASTDGTFTVPQLDVGTYTVKVTAQGFKAFTATELKIDVGRPYSLAVTLEPGGVNENVTVVAGADVLNATNAELSNTVSSRQIQELPLNGRNPLVLLTLQPGAASNGATDTAINGQRTSFTNITRDGINIQDNFIRANATDFAPQRPGVDDISQFTVTTSNADAALGYGASQVNIATERGQSEFHGTLFEYNRNSKFSSRPFFSPTRAFLNRNQYGFKIGGPSPLPRFGEGGLSTYHNKGFFFFNYEGFRQRQTTAALKTILLPNARNGIFTYVDSGGTTRTINLFGPTLGGLPAFGITAVNPVVANRILAFVPTAGNTTDAGDQRNTTGFRLNVANNVDRNNFTGRFDVEPNTRHSFNFIYAHGNENNDRPDVASGYTPAPLVEQPAGRDFLSTGWTWTPGATLTNEVRAGFFKSSPVFDRVQPEGDFLLSIPLISNPETTFQDQGRFADNYTLTDNATYSRGNHSIRFGGTGTHFNVNSFAKFTTVRQYSLQLNAATGTLPSGAFPGGISSAQLTAANNLLALLGGVAGRIDQTFNAQSTTSGFVNNTPARQIYNYENYGFYGTDQWRIGQHLTLNLGARYEIYTALREKNGFALEPVINGDITSALLNPTGTVDFIGHNGGKNQFYHTDKNNIGPVVSVAWSPDFKNHFLGSVFGSEGRTVVRGGYRISYVNDEYIRAPDNAQSGNAGLSTSRAFLLGTADGNRLGGPLFTIDPPAFAIPRTFAAGDALSGVNFGTIFAVDPHLENPATHEWNFGIQREIGFQTAVEIRYVGGKSDNLVRGIDLNEAVLIQNGFAADFIRAYNNCAAQGATLPGTGTPLSRCTSANFNAAIPGSVPLTVFPGLPGGGLLTNSTILGLIRAGTPADLINTYVQQVSATALGTNGKTFDQFFLPNPNAGSVDLLTNGAKYRYHSLQAEIRRRFANGFHLQANYTFQKTLTNASGVGQTNFEPNLSNLFPQIEYARANYDATHVFNLNTIYELPFG
ncbi:MAG TPA: TonB-dependent receptor [Pyrinomonadaceae bacterium]|nr:TonB-dependent receptor [Pyrinomonadaceae bacterium]